MTQMESCSKQVMCWKKSKVFYAPDILLNSFLRSFTPWDFSPNRLLTASKWEWVVWDNNLIWSKNYLLKIHSDLDINSYMLINVTIYIGLSNFPTIRLRHQTIKNIYTLSKLLTGSVHFLHLFSILLLEKQKWFFRLVFNSLSLFQHTILSFIYIFVYFHLTEQFFACNVVCFFLCEAGWCMRSLTTVAVCTSWREETTAATTSGRPRPPTSSPSAGSSITSKTPFLLSCPLFIHTSFCQATDCNYSYSYNVK